jgi:ribosomal protein S18 acetylase RimI-like enzyme
MKMTLRDNATFERIRSITNDSFFGVERPPEGNLRYVYNESIGLYLNDARYVEAYALVTLEVGLPYIWSIATDPKFRLCGHAKALLKEIIADHADETIELTVNVDNPAQKLYFDHGFRVVAVMRRYYGEMTGLRMRRKP